MLYSKTTNGFYLPAVHGKNIPGDAVKVPDDLYAKLMRDQERGCDIMGDADGLPISVEPTTESAAASCTPAQGLVALFALKQITEDNVLAAIGQIPDPVQQYTARIGYQRATVWERNSPTMQALAQLLQLSETDLDALFAYAVEVQV